MEEMREAVEEMQLLKSGKKEARKLEELLNYSIKSLAVFDNKAKRLSAKYPLYL